MTRALLVLLACFGFATWGLVVHSWWWVGLVASAVAMGALAAPHRALGRLDWAIGCSLGLAAGEAFVLGLKGPHGYEVVDPLIVYGALGSALGLLLGGVATFCAGTGGI